MKQTISHYRKRIQQARQLEHEESREQLLSEIRKELSPLIKSMYTAIGQSIRFHDEDPEDLIGDPDEYLSAETFSGETVHLSNTNVVDTYQLSRIRDAIANLNLEEAKEISHSIDTAVREKIPADVYEFLRDIE